MNRTTAKNRINAILRSTTAGYHSDDYWKPVNEAFSRIREQGFDLTVINTRYGQDERGCPNEKVWLIEIGMGEGKKPIPGIVTAHGAGTVSDPLSSYDISAYVS